MDQQNLTIEDLVQKLNELKKKYPPNTDIVAMALAGAEYLEVTKLMNMIGGGMREIERLPSEEIVDKDRLLKTEFPCRGGVYTYMENHPYPYRGFPFAEFVDKIDMIKKVSRGALSGVYHCFKKRNKLTLLTLLPSLWAIKDLVRSSIYTFYRLVDRFKLRPIRFSEPMRELYRSFSVPIPNEKNGELRLQARDLACMFMEFDNAYRFRFQDIMEELNKENLKKKPIRELLRLLKIMGSREKTQEIKDSWKLTKYAITFYLVFDRQMLKIIVNTLNNLDIERVKLSPEDKHFCEKRKDYNFGHYQKVELPKLEIKNVSSILNESRNPSLQV